jgi:hypothetical protein
LNTRLNIEQELRDWHSFVENLKNMTVFAADLSTEPLVVRCSSVANIVYNYEGIYILGNNWVLVLIGRADNEDHCMICI